MKKLEIAKERDYFGLRTDDGKWILEPVYDEISEFNGGYARIKKDDLVGLVNEDGRIVIPLEYDEIKGGHEISFDYEKGKLEKFDYSYFSQKRAIVGKSSIKDGKVVWQWGFVNEEGETVTPIHFDKVKPFKDGIAKVRKEGGIGLIDLNGDWILHPIQKNIGEFHLSKEDEEQHPLSYVVEIENFHEDLAVVAVQRGWDKKYGYIRRDGSWFKEPIYYSARPFNEGVGQVEYGHWGIIDKKGDWVVKSKFSWIGDFHEGLAVAKDLSQNPDDFFNKCGYINIKGQWIIPPQFYMANPFHEGIAQVMKRPDGKWENIDKTGNFI